MKKIDYLIVIFLILFSLFTLKDLFKPGFYTSHDGIHQVVRLYYFDQVLKDGQIPPRWVGGLLNGFGYPLFNFSYQMPWFIGETFHLIGLDIINSIKMTFLLGFILSGITMYFFLKEVFGRGPGFVGAFLYLFAPFRFVNIFVRAAIGDATVFIFFPLVFLSIFKLKNAEKIKWKWIVIGAASMTAILLSHAMIFLFFFLVTLMYVFYEFLLISKKRVFIKSIIIMMFLTLGLSSYYFLPSFFEQNLTRFSEMFTLGGSTVKSSFLTFKDLLYSPWGYGQQHNEVGSMSFQVGIAQWATLFISLIILALLTFRKKYWQIYKFKEAAFFVFVFLISIFLMLPFSMPFWLIIGKIVTIDFPWRVFPLTIFSLGFLAAFTINFFKSKKIKIFLSLFLILLAIYANRNYLRINQQVDWPVSFYLKLEKTTNTFDEYTPKWARWELMEKPKSKVEFPIPEAKINISQNKSNLLKFTINTPKGETVRINTIYYPGWSIIVNDRRTNINYKDTGFMEFPIKKGDSLVVAKFQETPFRLVCDIISVLTFGFMGFIILKKEKS